MAKKKEEPMIQSVVTSKKFSYQKNAVSLGFSLIVDNSSEVRDFKDLLMAALKDIDGILFEMKN